VVVWAERLDDGKSQQCIALGPQEGNKKSIQINNTTQQIMITFF
jgi:hypothetical protein